MAFCFQKFQEDVDEYMKTQEGSGADTVLAKLDEQYQKYKFMEVNLVQKRLRQVVVQL